MATQYSPGLAIQVHGRKRPVSWRKVAGSGNPTVGPLGIMNQVADRLAAGNRKKQSTLAHGTANEGWWFGVYLGPISGKAIHVS